MKKRAPQGLFVVLVIFLWSGGFRGASAAPPEMRPGILPAAAASPAGRADPHVSKGRKINFNYYMTDGGGYRWDIQSYGSIYRGTNYAYGGGLYCQVNGSNIHSGGNGWINAAGDEVEIGPYSRNNLNCYRRIKVYKDRPLARWLDIFENRTSAPISVSIRIYTNTSYSIQQMLTSTGGGSFGAKDWAFITQTSGGNRPSLLHVVCGNRSKFRPTVQVRNNQIYVSYSLTVPAGKTSILCYFESQNHSLQANTQSMKKFPVSKLLRDLPSAVRKMIVNFTSTGIGRIDLERSETADTVIMKNGDPKVGKVTNESFEAETFFGKLAIPAGQIIGMAAIQGRSDRILIAMVDRQVVSARLPEAHLELAISSGSKLKISLGDVNQWSYRISDSRPDEYSFVGPLVLLRTGDRLAFDADALALTFRTRHGTVPLNGKDLLEIRLDNPANAVHRAIFLNGSRIAGFLEPEELSFSLRLGATLRVNRNMVKGMLFAAEDKPDPGLTQAVLTNGDELFGRLADEKLDLVTEYGLITVQPSSLKAMSFSRTHLGRAAIQVWDGSVHRGQLKQAKLDFQITPGTSLKISPSQFVSIVRKQALPPDEIQKLVEKLVAQLGAESYQDRQAASKGLIKLGPGVSPLLKKYVKHNDPEIRQRITEILEKLGQPDSPTATNQPAMDIFRKGGIRLR